MRIPRLFLQSCHLNRQFQAWTAAQSCSIPGPGLCTVLCWASWIFCLCTSPVGWDPFCVWPAHVPALVPTDNLLGLYFVPFFEVTDADVKQYYVLHGRYHNFLVWILSQLLFQLQEGKEKKKKAAETTKTIHFTHEQHEVESAMTTTYTSEEAWLI